MNNQTFRANRFLLPVAVTSVLALAMPALGQVINEDVKLLASDGEGNDDFGQSIGIADGMVAVGSHLDDDNGTNSGSAYVFTVPGADCPADINGDGTINFFDVSGFLAAFNKGCP